MADWVKLATNMFDNKKIKQIEVAPKGKQMLLLWVRLICLAGTINDGGRVYVTKGVPYTNKGLAVELNESVAVVDAAMKLFREYKMIDIDDEHGLYLVGWEKHQNIEGLERIKEQNRLRKQRQRERDKLDSSCDNDDICHVTSRDVHSEVTQQNKNKKENKNRENNNSLSFSPSCHGVTQNVTQLYEQKIGLLNAKVAEQLADLLEQYGEERVVNGIKIAHERRAKTIGYVAKCVENPIPENKTEYVDPFKAVFGDGGVSNGSN